MRVRGPLPVPLEAVEQTHGIKLLCALGANVYVIGTKRSRGKKCPQCGAFVKNDDHGTHQTPGPPDVEFFIPHRPSGAWWFVKWEAKRQKGSKFRPEQAEYRRLCQQAKVHHVLGPCDALIAWLIEHEFLRPENVPHYRLPQSAAVTERERATT